MSQCTDNGWLCVWEHSPYSGHFARFNAADGDLRTVGGFNFNDKITDVWNRSSIPWCLYWNINFGTPYKYLAPGWRGYVGATWNDETSSVAKAWRDRFGNWHC
jgi:hypothetical protein